MDETNLPLPFVKLFGMTSGASVRGTVGLIFVRNIFNCFNFYIIDYNIDSVEVMTILLEELMASLQKDCGFPIAIFL